MPPWVAPQRSPAKALHPSHLLVAIGSCWFGPDPLLKNGELMPPSQPLAGSDATACAARYWQHPLRATTADERSVAVKSDTGRVSTQGVPVPVPLSQLQRRTKLRRTDERESAHPTECARPQAGRKPGPKSKGPMPSAPHTAHSRLGSEMRNWAGNAHYAKLQKQKCPTRGVP